MNTNTLVEITDSLFSAPWFHQTLWGNELWQYLVLFAYVLAAVFLSKLADVLMWHRFKTVDGPLATTITDRLLQLARGPVKLAVFIVLLHAGIKPMNKPEWMQEYLDHAFGILVAIIVTYAFIRAVDVGFEIAREHLQDSHSQHQILPLLRKACRIFVVVTGVLVTADNNGIKVGGLIGSLGLTGLAVALAAQETLSNLLGSIVILADRPFLLGDRVKIDPHEGVIEHIGLRSTRLRTASGDMVIIPNRSVAGSAVINYTRTDPPSHP
jgi:MscS family membrane protein